MIEKYWYDGALNDYDYQPLSAIKIYHDAPFHCGSLELITAAKPIKLS